MELLPFNRIRALSGAAPSPPSKRVLLTATKKVCLICSCVPKIGFQDDNLHVIIFDLNSNPKPDGGGFVPVAPVLRIKCDFFLASCVLNSILYLFDGYDGKLNREGKAVYTYDLSGADPTITGPIMEKDELDRTAPPMNGIKLLPVALPTPDNNENGAYDIHKQTKLEIPLPLEDLPLSSRHRRGHATLLDRGGGEPSFCFLGSNLDGMHPRVFIDVHDFDLAQFHPSNSRSHQFVQGAVPYLSFSPAYLFPIRD